MAKYIPERGHLVWLDFEPTKGKEIGKYRPALVLSSREYNKHSGFIICCPVSTSIRGCLSEVSLHHLQKASVVVSNIIQTLNWQERKARFIAKVEGKIIASVLCRLLPLIGVENL